jgi:hypothetical protein
VLFTQLRRRNFLKGKFKSSSCGVKNSLTNG